MYKIILYNNGKKVKTFRSYNLYSNAIKKYRYLLKANKVFFPKEYLWDGSKTDYELVLVAPPQNKAKEYVRNELGGVIKLIPKGDFTIKQVEKYAVEDSFKKKVDGKKYDFKTLIKKILSNSNLTYTLIVINNKLVIERFEDEVMDVFVLKNKEKISFGVNLNKDVIISKNALGNFAVEQAINEYIVFNAKFVKSRVTCGTKGGAPV